MYTSACSTFSTPPSLFLAHKVVRLEAQHLQTKHSSTSARLAILASHNPYIIPRTPPTESKPCLHQIPTKRRKTFYAPSSHHSSNNLPPVDPPTITTQSINPIHQPPNIQFPFSYILPAQTNPSSPNKQNPTASFLKKPNPPACLIVDDGVWDTFHYY